MTFIVSASYPNDDDTTFDLKYYLDTHMALISQNWTPYGLQKWNVIEFSSGPDGEKPLYCVAAYMTFKDEASYVAASTCPQAEQMMGDIANFCNKMPVRGFGKAVGSS